MAVSPRMGERESQRPSTPPPSTSPHCRRIASGTAPTPNACPTSLPRPFVRTINRLSQEPAEQHQKLLQSATSSTAGCEAMWRAVAPCYELQLTASKPVHLARTKAKASSLSNGIYTMENRWVTMGIKPVCEKSHSKPIIYSMA